MGMSLTSPGNLKKGGAFLVASLFCGLAVGVVSELFFGQAPWDWRATHETRQEEGVRQSKALIERYPDSILLFKADGSPVVVKKVLSSREQKEVLKTASGGELEVLVVGGAPDEIAKGFMAFSEAIVAAGAITFVPRSAELDAAGIESTRKLAELLKMSGFGISIVSVSDDAVWPALAEQRGVAIRDRLSALGVSTDSITLSNEKIKGTAFRRINIGPIFK